MFKKIYITLVLVALPVLTFAQLNVTTKIFGSIDNLVTTILVPLVFTLALLFFFWGVAKYIWSAGDKEEGKKIMVWGVVALFVMSSIWGLVAFFQDELLIDTGTEGTIPTIK